MDKDIDILKLACFMLLYEWNVIFTAIALYLL